MAYASPRNLRNLVFLSSLVALAGAMSSCSQSSTSQACADIDATIDRNIVDVAVSAIDGDLSDKSAVQQAARLAQINNRLSTIMVNVQLQAQNRCAPRQKPIDASSYSSQAMSCYRARLEVYTMSDASTAEGKATTKAKAASACDFKSWDAPTSK